MRSFSKPVHRSLLQREMIGGIPQLGLLFLFILGLIFVYGLQFYYAIIPIVLIYFIMRHFTKKDQWLIDMFLEHINQKEKLIP
jgi:type IV secretory pathway TrbD component